jgi:hypothetical protein
METRKVSELAAIATTFQTMGGRPFDRSRNPVNELTSRSNTADAKGRKTTQLMRYAST